jgi:hypothetical protein
LAIEPVEIQEKQERGELDDARKVGKKEHLQKLRYRQDKSDIAFILSHAEGRRFYWGLMKQCGIFKSSFTGNNTTFFNEGERNIGLKLLSDLNEIAPEAYVLMIKEDNLEKAKEI